MSLSLVGDFELGGSKDENRYNGLSTWFTLFTFMPNFDYTWKEKVKMENNIPTLIIGAAILMVALVFIAIEIRRYFKGS